MTYFMIYWGTKAIREEFPCCSKTRYISLSIFPSILDMSLIFFPFQIFFSVIYLSTLLTSSIWPLFPSHLFPADSSNSSCLADAVIPCDLNHHSTEIALLTCSPSVEWIYVPPAGQLHTQTSNCLPGTTIQY